MDAPQGWRIAGDYLEACNCEAICPCRKINGIPGGRSTYGVCMGALSWVIREGQSGGLDLAGLAVGLVLRYSDDEEGSPWTFALYLDERATAEQRAALEAIFLGRAGGAPLEQFPWVRKPSHLLGVHAASIEIDREPRRAFRVRDRLNLRIAGPFAGDETVTCVIPGHHREGHEVVADVLRVDEPGLTFEFTGRCGYATTFDYAGPGDPFRSSGGNRRYSPGTTSPPGSG